MNFLFPHTLSWVTFFTKEILSDDALVVSMTLSMLSLRSSWGLSPPMDSFCFPRLPCEPGSEMTRQQKPQSSGPRLTLFQHKAAEVGPSVHTYWASAESHRGSARVSRACRAVCWFHAPQRWLFPSVFVLCCGVLFFNFYSSVLVSVIQQRESEWVEAAR